MDREAEQIRYALKAFFMYHKHQPTNAYSTQTIIDKMRKGDVGSFTPRSIVPKGIHYTDMDLLWMLKKTEQALRELEQDNRQQFYTIILKYSGGCRINKVASLMSVHRNTVTAWDKKGVAFFRGRL